MIKRSILSLFCVVSLSAVTAMADSKDDIKAALQKLSDSPNYSWKTESQGGFMRGTTDGKTEKDGFTYLSMQFRDNTLEMVIKGDKVAVKTDDGWKSGQEILDANQDTGGGPPPPEVFAVRIGQNFRTPAAQAMENVDALQNIQKTDTGYTADFSDDAAKKLLMFRPRRAATTNPDDNAPQMDVSNAKASIQLTVKDGDITQIQIHSTGTISFNGNDRDVDRTTTTDISAVGSTTVTVPDDAKPKLQ
jgi:hypothetical protein